MTRKELAELGLENLVGSDMLKAYMHGYFVDNKLYQRAKAVANPSLYEDYRKQQARKKQQEKKEKRITLNSKKPAVNAELAERWERDGKVGLRERRHAEGGGRRAVRKALPERGLRHRPAVGGVQAVVRVGTGSRRAGGQRGGEGGRCDAAGGLRSAR